jgi:hypothetical protein
MEPSSLTHSQDKTTCPALSQINLKHAPHTSRVIKFNFNILHFLLGFRGGLFPSVLPTKTLYATLLSPMRLTYPFHRIVIYLITLIRFGDE